MRFLLLCVLCLYAPGPDRAVAAEAAPENTVSLEGVVGFSPKSGQARPGCFTPVHVQLTTKGEPFRGEIVVRSIAQKPQAFDPLLAFPCEVGINTVKRFSDIFYVRDSDQTLLAELWVKGKKIGETHMGLEMIPASRHTILALAEADGRLDHLAAAGNPLPARRRKVIYGLAEYLPTHSRGYDGVDSVVVDGGDLTNVDGEQVEAFRQFLEGGGQVVACSGSAWQSLKNTFLADWLPVNMEETVSLPSPFPTQSADRPSTAPHSQVLVCRASTRQDAGPAEILWQPDGAAFPFIVRRPFGAGRLTFLAFRPEDAAVRQCGAALEPLLVSLFPDRGGSLLQRLGAEQADRVASELKQKALLPIPDPDVVGAAFLGYLALFLPALFFAARWWGGRRWAWASLPAGFIGATAVIFAHGRDEAGRQRVFVEMNFVERAAGSPLERGRSFSTVYSSSSDRLQIQTPEKNDLFLPLQTTKVEAVATEPFFYSTRPTVMIRDLELPARSSRCFQLEFVREAQSAGGPNALLYSRTAVQNPDDPFSWKIENETVAGTVVNETDVELRDAAVIALGRAYELKDLPPGQAVALRCDKTQGVALDLWSSMAKTARTSKEMSASASIAEAGRMILAGQLSADPGEACLVGWTEANPAAFTAYSRSGQPPIFPWRSSAATWRVIRYPTCVAGGEIHLESGDFDVEGWNLDEKHFHWNARVEFYDANARVDDQWMIRFRPRLKFVSGGGQSQWPVETAWGNLKDNWEGKPMEVFDFSQGRWALAPAPRNGRRILPPRAGAIDQQTGELWIRLSGATVFMRDVKIDLTLNYRLRP